MPTLTNPGGLESWSLSTTKTLIPKGNLPERDIPVRDYKDASRLFEGQNLSKVMQSLQPHFQGLALDHVSVFDFSDLPDGSENLRYPGIVILVFSSPSNPRNILLIYVNGETYEVHSLYDELSRGGIITANGLVALKTNTRKTIYETIIPTQDNLKPKPEPKEIWIHKMFPSPDPSTWKEIDLFEYQSLKTEGDAYDIVQSAVPLSSLIQ